MRIVTSINGLLHTLRTSPTAASRDGLVTGLAALDELAPSRSFVTAAIHEIIGFAPTRPLLLPILLAKAAAARGHVVWCDFDRMFYPPAAAALGMPLERMIVLRPSNPADELWAVAEALRCKGVSACIAPLDRLSRIHARRLQLAAEHGGGIGVLLRPARAIRSHYAAVTRWLVRQVPGERSLQRWSVELIHGHGGSVGQSILLEICRETHHVRALETVVNRQVQTPTGTA